LRNEQTNVLITEECILKNKNKRFPYIKLSTFYNSCLKTFWSHLAHSKKRRLNSANYCPLPSLIQPAETDKSKTKLSCAKNERYKRGRAGINLVTARECIAKVRVSSACDLCLNTACVLCSNTGIYWEDPTYKTLHILRLIRCISTLYKLCSAT
jgi:hypothetical protein